MKVIEIENCSDCPDFRSIEKDSGEVTGRVKCQGMDREFTKKELLETGVPDWCPLPDKGID